ncbi:MAG TPA: hypothetical protein VK926_00240 [Gaiellaceae bacterium]|nr:hypothetical protein [Gaiellaceae bacterium]
MSAAVLTSNAAANSTRLLADVKALDRREQDTRAPALLRLEAAIGRDLADRLVTALSGDPRR